MAISDEITRLQQAKADIKTAVENKGVTVSSNTKLDDYADLIDSIETGGGGSMPTIVNPFNGDYFGTEYNYGTITHQYEVSESTIDKCYLAVMHSGMGGLYGSPGELYVKSVNTGGWGTPDCIITIDDSGLLSCVYNRSQSDVEEYPWISNCNVYVLIELDNGTQLIDIFRAYTYYSCFVKGTKIILFDWEKKAVEDITYDDELLVWNFDEGRYDSAKPLWIKKVLTTNWYYKLTFSDGTILKVTGAYPEAHSLYSVEDGKFVHANNLVGKKVYTLNGVQTLDSCEEIHEDVEFYNIITDYHMNLFANNVLTSTSLNNLYPIRDMMFIKDDRKPVFDTSTFNSKLVNGLRLNEQQENVTDYVNNLIRLQQ